jgi:hypothetical protein
MVDALQQSKPRYPEKALQQVAIDWVKQHWSYTETFSDEEARGARIDRIGLLHGKLTLIEVKVSVTAGIIEHRSDRSQSLESKIAGTLGPMYRREADAVADTANSLWDRKSPPLLVILAQDFSNLAELETMLIRRSADWHFDFAIWRGTGSLVEILANRKCPVPEPLPAYETIVVPCLVGRSPRERARSIGELIKIGEERGVGDLVSHLVRAAPTYGFILGTGRWTIALKSRVGSYTHPQTVVGVYLDVSSPNGLNVGCWCEAVGVNPDNLPGKPTRVAGYMNTNRIVTSVEEVDAILEVFAKGPTEVG